MLLCDGEYSRPSVRVSDPKGEHSGDSNFSGRAALSNFLALAYTEVVHGMRIVRLLVARISLIAHGATRT